MIIDDMIEQGLMFPAYIVARYCYRVGLPTISDADYDQLEEWLKIHEYERCKNFLERSYDDDPVPYALLERLGICAVPTTVPNELYQFLEEDKSRSIRAIRTMNEAWEFVCCNKGKELFFSLKIDGVNGKSLYKDGQLQLCLSRGRASNSFDYTLGAKHVAPVIGCNDSGLLKITGEYFADKDSLANLREKYNQESYKTSKSSAISMLRVEHDQFDYKYLNLLAYTVEGKDFSTVEEMYKFLQDSGIKTPPHFIRSNIPDTRAEFEIWLNNVLDEMYELGKELPSDGVVMEVNNLTEVYKDDNQYSDRQVAIKFGHWDFEQLVGTITDVCIEQQRVYKSVRIVIEPMYSSDGCKAEVINSYNPSILIQHGLYKGQKVHFERNSGAVNILIHGKRLELSEGENEPS